MRSLAYPAALVLSGLALCAHAQNLKPGLWEVNTRMQTGSGEMEKALVEMQQQLAAMPPEQRKMMQDMMAKQGVGMGAGGPGAMSVKLCMSKEMVERNEVATHEGECKSSYAPRIGNSMKISFVCSRPPSSGEGQVSFVSPEVYTSRITVTTTANGKTEKVGVDGQGKWLSAECGAIKAPVMPKK